MRPIYIFVYLVFDLILTECVHFIGQSNTINGFVNFEAFNLQLKHFAVGFLFFHHLIYQQIILLIVRYIVEIPFKIKSKPHSSDFVISHFEVFNENNARYCKICELLTASCVHSEQVQDSE